MNTTPFAFRLFSAAMAAAVTFGLLGTVCSIAEPQASVLMARQQQQQQLARAAATVTVAMAPAGTARGQ